jgi:hypothetical protein
MLEVFAVRSEHTAFELQSGLPHREICADVAQLRVEHPDNLLPRLLGHGRGHSIVSEGKTEKEHDQKRETEDKHEAPRTNICIIDPPASQKVAQ